MAATQQEEPTQQKEEVQQEQATKQNEEQEKPSIDPPPPSNASSDKKATWAYKNRHVLNDNQRSMLEKALATKEGRDSKKINEWVRTIKHEAGVSNE